MGNQPIATGIELRKSVILLLVLILLSAYPMTIVQLAKASVENVGTSCSILVDDIVEPQPITVEVQIYPAPPEGEVFNDISIVIVSPLQGTVGNDPWGTGPWDKRFSSDIDGKATVTFDIHTFGGYWIVDFYFGGQYFANNTIYYEPVQSQRNFFVSSIETPAPSPTVSPSPSPEPTFSPEPTVPTSPLPSEEPQHLGQDVFLGVVATVAVLAAGLGLLVYFKKRRREAARYED
jgi:hypothetical protein